MVAGGGDYSSRGEICDGGDMTFDGDDDGGNLAIC